MENEKGFFRLRPLLHWAARLLAVPAIAVTPWADDFLASAAVWPFKSFVCVLGGLLITLALLAFPRDWLARIEPNLITGLHFVLFWAGLYAVFHLSVYAGHLLVVASTIMDVLDGKAVKARAERGFVRSKLQRWIGRWLDPLVDKATVLPFLAMMAYLGIIAEWIAAVIIILDVAGTLLREPCTTLVHLFRYPSFLPWRSRLATEIGKSLVNEILDTDDEETVAKKKKFAEQETKASWVGKIKSLVQNLGMEICMPFILLWVSGSRLPDYVFGLAMVFGAGSIISRHLPPSRFMAWANSFFKHQDVL